MKKSKDVIIKDETGFKLNRFKKPFLAVLKTGNVKRYALNLLMVENDLILATDGVRMLSVSQEHIIETGLYGVSPTGYLYPDHENRPYPDINNILKDFRATKYAMQKLERGTSEQQFCFLVEEIFSHDLSFNFLLAKDVILPILRVEKPNGYIIDIDETKTKFELSFYFDDFRVGYIQQNMKEM